MVVMGKARPDWYGSAFDVRSTQLPWNESTEEDVERVLGVLQPKGGERVLDLGCGHGRHAIELTHRGFEVVGVDLSQDMIDLATEGSLDLDVEFWLADLRELTYADEFDLVLSLNSPLGYFEDDAQNRRAFETVARALRDGGRAFMQIPNVLHAEARLPERSWAVGIELAELIERRWDPDTRRMEGTMLPLELFGGGAPSDPIQFSQRLYSVDELHQLLGQLGMSLTGVFDAAGNPWDPSPGPLDIFVVAQKE